jgi:hypothetical protein
MTVETDSARVRFPPPLAYLGALLLGLAAERFAPSLVGRRRTSRR